MSVNLSTALKTIQQADWTFNHNFYIFMFPNNNDIAEAIGWVSNAAFQEMIQTAVKSVSTPQSSLDAVEKLIAGKWHISRNEDEIYTLSITFRDLGSSSLYRIFKSLWHASKLNYPDDCSFYIMICMRGRSDTKGADAMVSGQIYQVDKAYITGLSQMELSHETNEILEFSVEFKSDEPLWTYSNLKTSLNGNLSSKDKLSDLASKGLSSNANVKGAVSSLISAGLSKLKGAVSDGTKSAQQKAMAALGWD